MKFRRTLAIITITCALIGSFFLGRHFKPHYEFHSSSNGQVLWRCNLADGEAEWATLGGMWRTIASESSTAKRIFHITSATGDQFTVTNDHIPTDLELDEIVKTRSN